MASYTYDQVSAISEKHFLPRLADNFFDSNPLTQRAKKNFYDSVSGGERILMPVGFADISASGWYDGADVLSTTDNQTITALELFWRQLYANVSIMRKEELQNSGKAQIISLVKSKFKTAEKTMNSKMGTALYNDGTTADAIVGLRAWLNTSSTVGGISQSTNSWLQSQLDSTTTTLSMAAMQSLFNSASVDAQIPTVCMTTRTILNLYYALLQPQQRFSDKDTARGGFSSLLFNATPVIADSYCPANNLLMLNEKTLHLFYHKDENFRMDPFIKPSNQNTKTAKIYWAGSFGVDNPRLNGRMSAIAS